MRRLLSISIAAFWVALVPVAWAGTDYSPMTLFQMLTHADIALRGHVRNVTEGRYEIVVERTYHPAETPSSVVVLRTDTYPPDTRSGRFAEGQSVVILAEAAGEGVVRPLGAAAEGEMPSEGRNVYVRAFARPPASLVRTEVPGGTYSAYRVDVDVFDEAVAGFYACYRTPERRTIERICDADARDDYQRSSWLAAHLAGIAERLVGGYE